MFWISAGSLVIIFFSCRAYLNNQQRWQKRSFFLQSSRFAYVCLQGLNLILVVAAILFLMLAIVCHVEGYQLHFSSDYLYHMQLSRI